MKFQTGAFTFYRASRVKPCDPDEVKERARLLGLRDDLVPEYAGDRVTAARAISACASPLQRQGWLLRPIKTHRSHIIYGIVREQRNAEQETITHDHEATLEWLSDQPDHITSHASALHPTWLAQVKVGDIVEAEYQQRRGRIVAADWTQSICSYLVSDCQAAALRDDGRVYWLPPQHMQRAETLGRLLDEVGIRLILCEIESTSIETVKEAATDSLESELEAIQAEVAAFDGKQKPSTYTKRLEALDGLKRRALAYRDALGVTVTQYTGIIEALDAKTSEMLDKRQRVTLHRNGHVSQDVALTF